jgi:glutaredoxin 3
MARHLLDGKRVEYASIDVSGNDDARTWLREQSGQHTVPQIFIRGQSIGGFSELSALDRAGRLDGLV